MWIILLDCSGSMGEPFRGLSTFEGRSVLAKADLKLDAARHALLERLPGIGKAKIALFTFTEQPSFILDGEANERDRIRDALDQLVPNDGTDIAAALRAALEYADALSDPGVLRVLVVSDGLSDLEAAQEAAQSLAGRGAIIDVILIDPTDEGEAVARAIAIEGEVQAVTSPTGLAEHIGETAERHAALERQIDEVVRLHRVEMDALAARRPPEAEQVRFTAGYPGVISPDPWYPFVAVIHLADLADEVRARLAEQFVRQRLRGRAHLAEAGADHPISRGVELTLVPCAEGLEFNPRSVPVTWLEDIQEVMFRFRARPGSADKALHGVLDVYQNGLVVAGVPFRLRVRPKRSKTSFPSRSRQRLVGSSKRCSPPTRISTRKSSTRWWPPTRRLGSTFISTARLCGGEAGRHGRSCSSDSSKTPTSSNSTGRRTPRNRGRWKMSGASPGRLSGRRSNRSSGDSLGRSPRRCRRRSSDTCSSSGST